MLKIHSLVPAVNTRETNFHEKFKVVRCARASRAGVYNSALACVVDAGGSMRIVIASQVRRGREGAR